MPTAVKLVTVAELFERPEIAGGYFGSMSSAATASSPRNALVEMSSQLLRSPPQLGSLIR